MPVESNHFYIMFGSDACYCVGLRFHSWLQLFVKKTCGPCHTHFRFNSVALPVSPCFPIAQNPGSATGQTSQKKNSQVPMKPN